MLAVWTVWTVWVRHPQCCIVVHSIVLLLRSYPVGIEMLGIEIDPQIDRAPVSN